MSIRNLLVAGVLGLSLSGCAAVASKSNDDVAVSDAVKTADFYQQLVAGNPNRAMLKLFLTQMPKGGDLHHHYSGTIYAETYLEWVKEKGWFIGSCDLRIYSSQASTMAGCDNLSVDQLMADNAKFRKLLTLWSDKDYDNHFHEQVPPDSNFFNTFGYFGPISGSNMDRGLQIIKQRALKENVSYIETMLTRVKVKNRDFFSREQVKDWSKALRNSTNQQQTDALLKQIVEHLASTPDFQSKVDSYVAMLNDIHQGIDDENFSMRFQTYAVRVVDPVQVFLHLYAGFVAGDKSPLLVGVNIVAPENNHVALADYELHMQMYNYLNRLHPTVNRALHAGELTLGMVRPKDLTFHIKSAINVAKAERIGHGMDIAYENDSLETLKALKERQIPVEINLTSNQFILGVAYQEHPYNIYSAYDVPLVISTDDSGVSRNNLTDEYVMLAERYKPSYAQVKEYVYNSIKFSFLTDEGKQKQLKILDKAFADFESNMANFAEKVTF